MSNELLDAALLYASMGWPVFPLIPRDKKPAIKGWQSQATTDEPTIRQWWTQNPNYNVGIKTGDGLCVIDVDDKPDKHPVLGSDMLRDWELEHGEISETCCAKTGTGGMHYYFNVGDTYISGCESETIFIDLRCDGNLIVAPPSIHPDTGKRYEWDISPEDMPPTKASSIDKACIDWVYKNRKGADKDGKTDTSIPSGKLKDGEGRNEFLFKQGRSARGKGADNDTIAAFLTALNQTKCSPPLDDAELWKTIGSVCSVPAGMSEEAKKQQAQRGRPRKFDHVKVAKQLITDHGACFVDGMPAIRNGKLYKIGWKAVAREIIKINEDATRANQKEVQHYLQVMAEQKKQSPPELIAFNNGVLDIRDMTLREYSDDDVIPNIIPHNWNANAECAAVDNVLLKIACGESDILESLMEVMGVCMYRSTEFTQSAILLGEGSNGKSTYIRMIQALLGTENISSLDMAMLGKQFHTGQLAGKLANLGDDISNEFQRGDLLSVFKKLVDGNRVYADVKGVEGFEFSSYATQVFSANEFPRLADYTDGVMRRIFPIEFNAKFSKTDPDYDPRISRKITTEKACERLALLGVMGLQQVIEHNGFTPNSASSRRVEEIRADNNNVLLWALEGQWTTETLNGSVCVTLYQAYKEWCNESGLQAVSRMKFSRQINKEFAMRTVDEWVNGATKKVFRVA